MEIGTSNVRNNENLNIKWIKLLLKRLHFTLEVPKT